MEITPAQKESIRLHDLERTRIVELVNKDYENKSSKIKQEGSRNQKKR